MNLSSLPLVGHVYLSLTLTSLIIGVIVIILLDKKKKHTHKQDEGRCNLERENEKNVSCDIKPEHSSEPDSRPFESDGEKEMSSIAGCGVNGTSKSNNKNPFDCDTNSTSKITHSNISEVENNTDGTDENREESTCSSNDEDSGKAKNKRMRKPRKKHSCSSGGDKSCSKKKAVSLCTILMDAEDEPLQRSLEDLAAQFKTGGLTCSVRPVRRENQWFIHSDTTHLHIFLVTTSMSEPQKQLQVEAGDGKAEFLYSVVCQAGINTTDVRLSGEKLSAALSEIGGKEWLPLTDVNFDERQDSSPATSSVPTAQQYINKVLKKAAKLSKKCCGTSCSSKKAVDIEDLVTSFLPEVMPVKT